MWMGSMKESNLKVLDLNTPIEPMSKVIGVCLSHNTNKCIEKSLYSKIKKTKTKLILWLVRDLRIYGKSGESFRYITDILSSIHADCSRIGYQDSPREPFCLSKEKQERQNRKSSKE